MLGVVAIKFFYRGSLCIAFFEEFIIIEVTIVGRYRIEVTHIDGFGGLLLGEQGFIHLFAVADTDDLDFWLSALWGLMLEQVSHGFGLGLDGAGGGFLDEDVAILTVFESEEDEVDGLFEAHDEAGHLGFGEGDGIALTDLVNPKGNY